MYIYIYAAYINTEKDSRLSLDTTLACIVFGTQKQVCITNTIEQKVHRHNEPIMYDPAHCLLSNSCHCLLPIPGACARGQKRNPDVLHVYIYMPPT